MAKADLDKLKYSQSYLSMLIQGKHPNTGNVIFDPKNAENAGLVNCLRFLHQHISNEIASIGVVLRDFALTEQSRRSIPITYEGVNITRFVELINKHAKEPDMNRLRGREVTAWLMKEGYLHYTKIGEKNFRTPTDKGRSIGISSNEYISGGAHYEINVYNADAQKFIIDNIDNIVRNSKSEE